VTDPDLPGWRRLGCAILLLAYRDAHEGNGHSQDARQFLAGPGARRLVAWLELDAGGLAVALQDLPPPAYEQLALPLGERTKDNDPYPKTPKTPKTPARLDPEGDPVGTAAAAYPRQARPAPQLAGVTPAGCVTGQLAGNTRRRRRPAPVGVWCILGA